MRWRSSSAGPSRNISARETEPSAACAAAKISALSAPWSSTLAAARATSSTGSGRSISSRQRERMVGRTRPGAWLISSRRQRGGGSSSTFSRAFSPDFSSSSTAIDDRHPPAALPGGRPEERYRAPHVIDPDRAEQLAGLLVEDALQRQQIGVGLPGDTARHRAVRRHGERRRLLHRRRRRIGMRQHECRHAIGQRRLADPRLAADQPGVRDAAALVGFQQRLLGLGVAEQRRGLARVRQTRLRLRGLWRGSSPNR